MVLTLFSLENSRSFRVHWLALELNVPIKVRNYKRVEGKSAEPSLAKDAGYNKSPCLIDDNGDGGKPLLVMESNNCMIYIAERYGDKNNTLLPSAPHFGQRTKVLGWMDFSETILNHALALVYPVWFSQPGDEKAVSNIQDKASGSVHTVLDEVEAALKNGGGPYICGEQFTAADIALAFSCEFTLVNKLGTGDRTWPGIEAWLRKVEARDAYQKVLSEGPNYQFILAK